MSRIAEMMSPIKSNIAPIIGMSRITMKMPNAIESINPMFLILIINAEFEKNLSPSASRLMYYELSFIMAALAKASNIQLYSVCL